MENEKVYIFIFKLALTFRLSLVNICKLLGKENTEKNKFEIYNVFVKLFGSDEDIRRAYEFLFNYETLNEPENISNKSLSMAVLFLKKYKNACESGNKESIDKITNELTKIDKQFKELSYKDLTVLTDEDALIISKYRLKYALTKEWVCNHFNIGYKKLESRENNYENRKLKYKLNLLSNYYLDLKYNSLKRNVK